MRRILILAIVILAAGCGASPTEPPGEEVCEILEGGTLRCEPAAEW